MNYDGLDPAALSDRLAAPYCLALERVTSTLDIIHEMASEGAPGGTLVLADEQVQGRGRQRRRWHSPKGGGVWLGSLQRPAQPLEGGLLAVRVGLASIRALQALGVAAKLKWPNDVMVNDRKLGGILCEARWRDQRVSWVAVGIGINVHGPLPAEIAGHAIALDEVLPGGGASRLAVLEALVPWLLHLSDEPSLSAQERREYEQCSWLADRRLLEPVAGYVAGIDEDGALLIKTTTGVERVVGGSIVAA